MEETAVNPDNIVKLQQLHIHSNDKVIVNNSNRNWSEAIECVRRGYLPELKFAEERPYNQHDFLSHLDRSYKSLQFALDIIASETNISKIKQYLENWNFPKTIHVFVGGKFRQDSVRIGIESLSDSGIIVIHDAARPFITNKMLIQGLNEVKKTGCSTVAIKTTDSMKIVSSENFSIKSFFPMGH